MKYTARVMSGRGEGRELGFPTLNIEIPESFAAEHGVYAGWVWLGPESSERLPAAIHYGPIPTFGLEKVCLEAHVIGKDIPSPPAEVSYELVKYLRKIKAFPSLEALTVQLQEDVRQARLALEGV